MRSLLSMTMVVIKEPQKINCYCPNFSVYGFWNWISLAGKHLWERYVGVVWGCSCHYIVKKFHPINNSVMITFRRVLFQSMTSQLRSQVQLRWWGSCHCNSEDIFLSSLVISRLGTWKLKRGSMIVCSFVYLLIVFLTITIRFSAFIFGYYNSLFTSSHNFLVSFACLFWVILQGLGYLTI